MMKQFCNGKSTPSIVLLMLMVFIVYSIFSVTIGAPIMGSDEYAYFIRGKYLGNMDELNKLDPELQEISNLVFFQLINVWEKFTGYEFIHAFRLFHVTEYILTAFVLHQTFIKIIGRKCAFFGMLVFLLLPSAFYIYTVMPETELVLLAACLGYVLIVVFPRRLYMAAVLAGVLLGISILIKPHAVAMVMASAVTMFAASFLGLVKGGRTPAVRSALIMLITCYLSLVLLWRLCSYEWVFDPVVMLGMPLYGEYIQVDGAANKVMSALHYAVAHLAVIALIFSPVLVWSISTIMKSVRRRVQSNENKINGNALVALYILTMLVCHLAMTAWFTAGAAELYESEAMRLHGRYLGAVFAFFPFLYFHAIKNITIPERKVVNLVMLAALFSCLFYFFRVFKIFPWDYPILFAFFNAPNHYEWNFVGSYDFLGLSLLWGMIIIWLFAIFFKQIHSRILFMQIFIIILVGCVQTYGWVYSHTKSNRYLIDNSRAISMILGQGQFGKGLLVSDDRFGLASYILFGLANAPKVLIKKSNSSVSADEVDGAAWILFANEYTAEFDYLQAITVGPFRFFPLTSGLSIEDRVKPIMESNQKIRLLLGENQYMKARLKDFNRQEDWGVWSAKSRSEIEMPFFVQGALKLTIFVWTLPENLKKPLSMKIGDALSQVALTDSGKEYEILLNVSQPSDRIILESPVFQPANSHRVMGVGISWISIEQL